MENNIQRRTHRELYLENQIHKNIPRTTFREQYSENYFQKTFRE